VVTPFLQSYLVVADELVQHQGPVKDEKAFLSGCLQRGEEYRLRGLIAADGVSTVLFRQALALARNRGLVDSQAQSSRDEFAAELGSALRLTKRNTD
jgi:glycerol-3-phosphate O-acyltransferase